jgi:transposase
MDEQQLVWVDECGLQQDLYRLHARSPRGKLVEVDIHDHRFAPRISIIAAYHQHHLQAPFRFEGSTDTMVFNTWLEYCLIPTLQPNQVVIMDNARFHQSARTRELIESADCHLLFQPAYSPDLNKIEHQWAVLKQGIRADLNSDLSFIDKLDQKLLFMSEP